MTARRVVVGLGANLGEPAGALAEAVRLLAAHDEWRFLAVSSLWSTAPVGGPPGQPDYLNAVAVAEVPFGPRTTLGLLHVVEQALGRTREVHWGARTLDLDLLAVDDLVSDDPALTLPHPRAYERAFVVQPWLEVDPDATVQGAGRLDRLPAAAPDPGVRRLDQRLPGPWPAQLTTRPQGAPR